MLAIPSYVKIAHAGDGIAANAFIGTEIIIQEKIDGSQFGFGWNENGDLTCRSKGKVQDIDAPDKMFTLAVEYCRGLETRLPDTYFYCEYLNKPKHNVLCYDHTPKHNLVLFDVLQPDGQFIGKDRKSLEYSAEVLGIDVVPELYRGPVDLQLIKDMTETPPESFLGREKIEGVVCKNYDQVVNFYGHLFPLMVKHVREAFKEKHSIEWSSPEKASTRLNAQTFVQSFKTDGRWQKAIIHARENGTLTNSPKDIGPLIRIIQEDIKEEEREYIKATLYSLYIDDVLRNAISGFPEWYKNKLLEGAFEKVA